MAGILGSVRALGLVAIVAVMFSGVAEADNPCYHDCFKDCTSGDNTCMFNPQCIATCGITCGLQDTCKHGSRKVLRNSAKLEEALLIQSDTIKKNTAGNGGGNPCYLECVKDCLDSCSFVGCASCPAICGTHDTCKDVKKVEINSAKAVAIHSDITEKNSVGGNPCYAECVQNCLNGCGLFVEGCATCPVICGMRDTCKHKINSAKPEEALVIQSDTIKKNTAGNGGGNPCYEQCVIDCLNSCSFVGCATCPAICGTHDTCKDVKKVEINSAKPEEAVAILSDITEKNSVGESFQECLQHCIINCGDNGVCIVACPFTCAHRNTCKDVKKVEINSGKLEDVAKSHVGVEERNILRLNTVADE